MSITPNLNKNPLDSFLTQRPAKSIAICSGKSGVGKSIFAANIALALVNKKNKVLLVDADFNKGTSLLQIKKGLTLQRVLEGKCELAEAIQQGPHGISIIPSNKRNVDFSTAEYKGLIDAFNELSEPYDYVIIDTSSGLSQNTLSFCQAAEELILVTTQQTSSTLSAINLMNDFSQTARIRQFHIVINMAKTDIRERTVIKDLYMLCENYNVGLNYLGTIPFDKTVGSCQTYITNFPRALASKATKKIADSINQWSLKTLDGNPRFFLDRFIAG